MPVPDVWAPLGVAGDAAVVDALTPQQRRTLPRRAPWTERARTQVADHDVEITSRTDRVVVGAVLEPDGTRHDVVSGRAENGAPQSEDAFLWAYALMPSTVLGQRVDMQRARHGRDRWCWRADGPDGRGWTWRPTGRGWADRMELVRAGDDRPVVTHTLRPVPGHPRSPAGPPSVTWVPEAALAEVLLAVVWSIDRTADGLLPKMQRVAHGDVL